MRQSSQTEAPSVDRLSPNGESRLSGTSGHAATGPGAASQAPPPRWTELLVLACWFGLVAGVLYAAAQLARQRLFHRFAFVSREVLWMAPLAHILLFVPIALAIAVLLRGRPIARTLACAILAFLAALAQLLPFGGLEQWSQIVLALGVAVQATRVYTARAPRASAWMRRSALAGSIGILVLVAVQHAWKAAHRRATIDGLPAVASGAPNVLLIILDTVRESSLSLYGYSVPTTPSLLQRAAESTVFENAYSTAPWTLPSHGTMMSGEYPTALPHGWRRPLRISGTTLAERLRDAGYVTGAFVGNLAYTSYESGLAPGFIDYSDYPKTLRMAMKHSPLTLSNIVQRVARVRSIDDLRKLLRDNPLRLGGHAGWQPVSAREITDAFLGWEVSEPAGHPFFAFLNYFDAHDPYRASPSARASMAASGKPVDLYDASIATIDEQLGRLFQVLAARNVLDKTVVVVASDHGEQFGEHGLKGHANSLYLPLIHVPLLIRYPDKVPAGQRVKAKISLRDIPATILDLTGVEQGPIAGVSLRGVWSRDTTFRSSMLMATVIRSDDTTSSALNATGPMASLIDGSLHYVLGPKGEEELFDITADPEETHNEIDDPDLQGPLQQMRAAIAAAIRHD